MLLSPQPRPMWTDPHHRWPGDDPFASTSASFNAGSFRWERYCILQVQRALVKPILLLFSALQTPMANQVSDRWLGLANSLNLESTQDTRRSLRIHHPCGAAHHLLVILRFCMWINASTREFFPTEPEGSIPSSAIRGVDACYPFPQPTNQCASQLTSRKAAFWENEAYVPRASSPSLSVAPISDVTALFVQLLGAQGNPRVLLEVMALIRTRQTPQTRSLNLNSTTIGP